MWVYHFGDHAIQKPIEHRATAGPDTEYHAHRTNDQEHAIMKYQQCSRSDELEQLNPSSYMRNTDRPILSLFALEDLSLSYQALVLHWIESQLAPFHHPARYETSRS